mmetsp:Transcript_2852/g.8315  ORF Transcript_2852/g.8315 Transcript_2852/m.8315 type:complete len:165 (-) Transcript_2852:28-522(-)|eukprot:CAMPEP_0119278514 /NCGR_PEP_ID=MMETSP1329-20130426/19248_1 /TAXON_ID=114041 /ORGANISM="Genus nov. species nov., Strain RCC1024" /LENGTH=164 /DNA_ID=CAMNT_0007279027 /DNA_START=189 /DNA_END=683 /DNA_ORIENTATION=+
MATFAASSVVPVPGTPTKPSTSCDCGEHALDDSSKQLSTSPASIHDFVDLPCGKAGPAVPRVQDDLLRDVEARVRAAVDGVTHLDVRDATDAAHVRTGFLDGRALAAHGRQIVVAVHATSFRGLKPLARHRAVMGALRSLVDSGALHSVQLKCKPAPGPAYFVA